MIDFIRIVKEIDWDNPTRGDLWIHTDGCMIVCPRCAEFGSLHHAKTINEDGTITMSPSIGCPICRAHFYIVGNQIKWLADY